MDWRNHVTHGSWGYCPLGQMFTHILEKSLKNGSAWESNPPAKRLTPRTTVLKTATATRLARTSLDIFPPEETPRVAPQRAGHSIVEEGQR